MTRQRIVIVGAGPAGLSTAFNLTDPTVNPGWQDRYEIDVYQLGWRVGGKGATGRNPDAGERIEEHGIHVFGNMYFNTLRMMAACYDEVGWDDHDRHRSMAEAFLPSLAAYERSTGTGPGTGRCSTSRVTDEPPVDGPASGPTTGGSSSRPSTPSTATWATPCWPGVAPADGACWGGCGTGRSGCWATRW